MLSFCLLMAADSIPVAQGSQLVLDATAVGSIRRVPGNVYAHVPMTGYRTGTQANESVHVDYRSYFRFDLTGVSGVIQSASFHIYTASPRDNATEGGFWSGDASETFELHGYAGSESALTSFPTETYYPSTAEYALLDAMFADLGDGPLFGSVVMTEALAEETPGSVPGQAGGRIWDIPLAPAAIWSLNAAPAQWVVGGALGTVRPSDSTTTEILFLGSSPFATTPTSATPIPQLVLTIADGPEADFDGNGTVDGNDFLIWQRHYGESDQTSNAWGDANGNGVVGPEDLEKWSSQFGLGSGDSAPRSVPESSTLASLLIGGILTVSSLRSRSAASNRRRPSVSPPRLMPRQVHVIVISCVGVILTSLGAANAYAAVRPLPLCPGDRPSPVYRLLVSGVETPVAFERFNGDFECHVAAVEIDAPVQVVLTSVKHSLEQLRIRPRRWNVPIDALGQKARFTLEPNQKIVLEVPGQKPLFLFAIPPEREAPSESDPNVRYFGPGEHHPGTIRLRSGQTLYLAAGARVHGIVYAFEAHDVSIRGRGVLDARGLTSADARTHGILFERCKNVQVEGIQLRTGDWWQCNFLLCDKVRVEHLHTLSFGRNNDGVDLDGVTDFRIADSFIGCGDDGFGWHALDAAAFGEPPTRDCLAERCVVWNEFAGNGLRIGASMETAEFKNIVFRDIDVLHAARNAIMSDHSDWADVEDVVFERFDNDTPRPLATIVIDKTDYSNQTGYRDCRGSISRLTFRDVTTSGGGIWLQGADPEHAIEGVRFIDCSRQGRPLVEADVLVGENVGDVAFYERPFRTGPPTESCPTNAEADSPEELVIDNRDGRARALAGKGLRHVDASDAHGGECWMIDGLGWGRAVAFEPKVEGMYEVSVHWGTHYNVATKAPWTVRHADGYATTIFDQNDSPGWKSLGAYRLNADSWVRLADPHYQISNGPVVADAVRFRRLRAAGND